MNKVINIEDNNYRFDSNKLTKTVVLKSVNPIVGVPFVAKGESDLVVEELCKRTNLEKRNEGIYFNNSLITGEMQVSLIIDELVNLAKEDLNNDINDLYLGRIVKNILKEQTVKQVDRDKVLLTEADLIKGLYGIEEGSKSL